MVDNGMSIFFFGLFIVGFFYIPGLIILSLVKLKLANFYYQFIAATVTGCISFVYLTLFIRVLHLPLIFSYIYLLFLIILRPQIIKQTITNFPRLKLTNILLGLSLSALILALAIAHLTNSYQGDYKIAAARDGLWRVAIINQMIGQFPPQVPGFPPLLLKNYHFFYDLLIASVYSFTRIPMLYLYFNLFTLFSASLFVALTYMVLSLFIQSRHMKLYGTFLTILTGNLAWGLSLLSPRFSQFKADIFMSNHPFDQSHNPFNLFAYALVLAIIYFYHQWRTTKNWGIFLVMGLFMGILPGIKIYAGMIVFSGFLTVNLYYLFTQKWSVKFLWPVMATIPIITAIKGSSFSILKFCPFWVLDKMVQDSDRVYLPDMVLKEQHFRQTNNLLRLTQIKITQLLIYFIGNLNIRILAILTIWRRFWKFFLPIDWLLFIFSMMIAALILPLVFNQTRAAYDSIQFTPYGLLLAGMVAVVVLDQIRKILADKKLFLVILFGLIMVVAIPTNLYILKQNIFSGKFIIAEEEITATQYLTQVSKPEDLILTDMDDEKLSNMYLPAIVPRKIYLNGLPFLAQLGIDTTERVNEINRFFTFDLDINQDDLDTKKDFLRQRQINYIYLSKSGLTKKTLMKMLDLKLVYQNSQTLIYEII